MAWVLLFSAGFVEIIFALSLKYNEGFTKLIPTWELWTLNVGN